MRYLLTVLMTLTLVAVPSAAPAGESPCDIVEPVYGVSADGSLVEHDFCVAASGSGFLAPRTIATFQGTPRLFWGAMLSGNASVIYGVNADGVLWWARQDPRMGALGSPLVVGGGFGDWNRYPRIISNGRGSLFALDSRGHLLRWQHLGWQDGSDTWAAGPEDLGQGCKTGAMTFASAEAPHLYVAVQDSPPGYVFCGRDGRVRLVSRLPEGVETQSVTMTPAPGVTYALTSEKPTLVRLGLHTRPAGAFWLIDQSSFAGYQSIFTGHALIPGSDDRPFKYEWQWPFYDGTHPSRTATTAAVMRLSTPSNSSRVAT